MNWIERVGRKTVNKIFFSFFGFPIKNLDLEADGKTIK